MEENGLENLLRSQERPAPKRGWRCPDEAQLAAYADSRLEGAARKSIEEHLADCRFCLDQVSFLVQSADWSEYVDVPIQLLAGAKNLVAEKPRAASPWVWRWTAMAATACLVLAIVLIIAFQPRKSETVRRSETPLVAQQKQSEEEAIALPQTSPSMVTQSSAAPTDSTPRARTTSVKPKPAQLPAPMLRSAEANGLAPKLLFPHDGATIKREELELRWQAAADALFYEIVVMTEAGDLTLEKKTEDTRLRISTDVSWVSGAKYFVWVRAILREGKTAKSGVVSFRILD